MESMEPQQTILNILKEHDGEKLTKSIVTRMRKELKDRRLKLVRKKTMTYIQWLYGDRLILRMEEFNTWIDTEKIKELNPELFDRRSARNAQREKLLGDPQTLELLSQAIYLYNHNGDIIRGLLKNEFSADAKKLVKLLDHVVLSPQEYFKRTTVHDTKNNNSECC